MVSGAPAPLRKLSFRRDVRLFLSALVGFLVVLILILVALLQNFAGQSDGLIREQWKRTADAAADDIGNAPDAGTAVGRMTQLQVRFGILGMRLTRGSGEIRSGETGTSSGTEELTRETARGTLHIVFDASRLHDLERKFRVTAMVCLLAALGCALMLVIYLPRITAPIEALLVEARQIDGIAPHADEQKYLIETFRHSIETLKAQEQELQQLHEYQKHRADELAFVTATLTRSLSSGLISVDPEGRIVDLNAAGREILGVSDDSDVRGRTVAAALESSAFSATLAAAANERQALTRREVEVSGHAGRQMIGLTTVPLIDQSSAFLGMLALFTDLTPVRQLETRVREMQTLADLGEIAAGIAHEFRNSLTTILGQLKLSRRGTMSSETLRSIERAEAEAASLADAVTGLLVFARPLAFTPQKSDVFALVSELCDRLDVAEGVMLTCEGEVSFADADPALLARAIDNLLRNAIDSVIAKGGGHVRVEVRALDGTRLRIIDDGVGIEPRDVPRLFLPFQSEKPNGYGIGLPLAKKIVLLHGGSIRLTGAPGAGAEAIVELPPSAA
jgi:PAS domain S-box-containing protein